MLYSVQYFHYSADRYYNNGHIYLITDLKPFIIDIESAKTYNNRQEYNNQLSFTSDYDCNLAMLLRLSRNGRLELTQFSVPTTSGTVSVIRKDAKRMVNV